MRSSLDPDPIKPKMLRWIWNNGIDSGKRQVTSSTGVITGNIT